MKKLRMESLSREIRGLSRGGAKNSEFLILLYGRNAFQVHPIFVSVVTEDD
jgi:hypothetical protein